MQPCWALSGGICWRFSQDIPHIEVAVPLAGDRFWVRVWVREWVNSRSTKIAPLNKEKGKAQSPSGEVLDQTIPSSNRKSRIPMLRTPCSSYHRLRMSWRTMILGKESPVREKGLFSARAFSSLPKA